MNVIISSIKEILDFGKAKSLWPLAFKTSCCGIELQQAIFGDYGFEKFTSGNLECSPKHADLLIIAGTVSVKALPQLINIYNKMPKPCYIITVGDCALNGGQFSGSYSGTNGVESVLPVDICLKGCPPKPEDLIEALKKLQEQIKNRHKEDIKDGEKEDLEPVLNVSDSVESPNKEALEEAKP